LDTSTLPVQTDVPSLFSFVRDSRFLEDGSSDPLKLLRRSSWLYPNDGCWVRASAVRRWAKDNGYGELKKAFIFGALEVSSPNAVGGSVTWWYHVVPAFQTDTGIAMVLDPAIDPTGALTLEEWVLRMVPRVGDATYAICSPATYSPGDSCQQVNDDADKKAYVDQKTYLDEEWTNLQILGRDPERELGDYPPWRMP
jgi:hypothetical protein